MRIRKRKLLILSIIIIAIAIYLNRSYALIYSYKESPLPAKIDIQRKYSLSGNSQGKNIKYIALGDSLTYGEGTDSYQKTFPYILSKKLLEKYRQVEVVNLAISGATAQNVLVNQLPQAIDEKPGFVTIMIGTNDVHNFTKLAEFKETLINIIDGIKQNTNAQILLINIPYLGTDKLILFPYNNLMDAEIRKFNQIIYEVANEKQVKYFDLYTAIEPFQKDPGYYSQDQFHPSAKGYLLWGDLISAD